jgi:hypothetical protein
LRPTNAVGDLTDINTPVLCLHLRDYKAALLKTASLFALGKEKIVYKWNGILH